jgi:hypothetical protein
VGLTGSCCLLLSLVAQVVENGPTPGLQEDVAGEARLRKACQPGCPVHESTHLVHSLAEGMTSGPQSTSALLDKRQAHPYLQYCCKQLGLMMSACCCQQLLLVGCSPDCQSPRRHHPPQCGQVGVAHSQPPLLLCGLLGCCPVPPAC